MIDPDYAERYGGKKDAPRRPIGGVGGGGGGGGGGMGGGGGRPGGNVHGMSRVRGVNHAAPVAGG